MDLFTDDETAIHNVLNRYERAMINREAKTLASLYDIPALIDGTWVMEEDTLSEICHAIFLFITKVEKFKLVDRDIKIAGAEATVEMQVDVKMDTFLGEDESKKPWIATLKKVSGKWKLTATGYENVVF
ncbi:MAG: hypothetical protein QM401_11795 [Bacillota bacterium]|nr:hypothetical protein [Bacillota bacterium]